MGDSIYVFADRAIGEVTDLLNDGRGYRVEFSEDVSWSGIPFVSSRDRPDPPGPHGDYDPHLKYTLSRNDFEAATTCDEKYHLCEDDFVIESGWFHEDHVGTAELFYPKAGMALVSWNNRNFGMSPYLVKTGKLEKTDSVSHRR